MQSNIDIKYQPKISHPVIWRKATRQVAKNAPAAPPNAALDIHPPARPRRNTDQSTIASGIVANQA